MLYLVAICVVSASELNGQENRHRQPDSNNATNSLFADSPNSEEVLRVRKGAITDKDHSQESTAEEDLRVLQNIVAMDAGQSVNTQLTQLGRKYLPKVYKDQKKWDRTKEFKTLIPRSEPLVLNHGTWRRYEVTPTDIDRNFHIRLKNMRSKSGQLFFTLECDISMDLEARQAKWVRGVQLYSINAVGFARLTLSLDCQVNVSFDFSDGTVMVITPNVQSSELQIHEFRIDRVSKVGGEVSQQITRAARDWLDDHKAKNQQKLVDQLNKQIVKNQDKLQIRLSQSKSIEAKASKTKYKDTNHNDNKTDGKSLANNSN